MCASSADGLRVAEMAKLCQVAMQRVVDISKKVLVGTGRSRRPLRQRHWQVLLDGNLVVEISQEVDCRREGTCLGGRLGELS
ncbi:hypothetical protein CBR_g11888 [Chara braunii]|uniref:Uncharacterized protein n=1 Tax=Chara braunii TaxID=69332 RepID=A0A388JSB6_CHABU|nr:hypothetical protein CBR_g11888 [Chara braunii]|eukprot:GBG60663.1 hypothetical protein CBR_g11888 [Chara braunii]